MTIVNDDGTPVKPTVTLAATDAAGAEQAQNPLVFTLTRSGSTAGALTVALAWGGAATYGTDYAFYRSDRNRDQSTRENDHLLAGLGGPIATGPALE